MRTHEIIFTVIGVLALTGAAFAYPTNYLSGKLGASVSTSCRLGDKSDPNAILSDEPWSNGRFTFADVDQRQVFIVDLGQEREFDRIHFGTGNLGVHRNANGLRIEVSAKSVDGPYRTVLEKEQVGLIQTLKLPPVKARWVRFDLGEGQGALVHSIRIYKGYKHPDVVQVTKLLHGLIKPDLPGLEKFYTAADSGNWKKAASELRAYYATTQPPAEPPNPDASTEMAQGFADGKLDFAGIERQEKPPFDWGYQANTDWYEHKNFLNRGRPIGSPIAAYYNTGDKKWLDVWRVIFTDWLDENPKPDVSRAAAYSTWRTLDSSMRSGWLLFQFPNATAAKGIDDELWANLLYNIWEHADFLHKSKEDGGNWLSVVTSGTTGIALQFPEFKDQRAWLEFGKDGFERNVLNDVLPDGKEVEDAPGYVGMAYGGMFRTLEALDKAEIEVDPEVIKRMDRMQDFLGAITQPNGATPAIGDWGGDRPTVLNTTSEYFKRDDIKYIMSKGAEGKQPAWTSINFPDGEWSMMRSPWDERPYEDARQLIFKASRGGHGHVDALHFVAYAYGRELLIDPSILSYEGEVGPRYAQTLYHNTVQVDGKNQSRNGGKTRKWFTNPGVDYLLADVDSYPGLTHHRSIVFVKPDYWIVHDEVVGEGSHRFDQNWHFPTKSGVVQDAATKALRTSFAEGGNITLVPAGPEALKSEPFDFKIATQRMTRTGEVDGEGWRYTIEGSAPAVFDTVLYPYKGATPPDLSVRKLDAGSTDVTALEVKIGDKTDYIFVSRAGVRSMAPREVKIEAEGEVVVVRVQAGKPVRVSGTNVRSATFAGNTLVAQEQPADLDKKLD